VNRRVRPRDARAPASASRRPRAGLRQRLGALRDLHLYSLVSSLGRLAQRPWATALTVGVMGVALALPLGLLLAVAQLATLAGDRRQARELSLFLQHGATMPDAAALAQRLRAHDTVAAVELRSPEQGLQEFQTMTEFAGALEVLDYNPLPSVLVVRP